RTRGEDPVNARGGAYGSGQSDATSGIRCAAPPPGTLGCARFGDVMPMRPHEEEHESSSAGVVVGVLVVGAALALALLAWTGRPPFAPFGRHVRPTTPEVRANLK